jgi:hypothetical protein
MEYFSQKRNTPGPIEYYLMQIASEVRRVLAKKPSLIKMTDFLISFGKKEPETLKKRTKRIDLSWSRMLKVIGIKRPEEESKDGSQ